MNEWKPARFGRHTVIYDAGMRGIVGCFIFMVVFLIFIGFISVKHTNPFLRPLPASGPRVPIPSVDAATLLLGRRVYKREGCDGCHTMTGVTLGSTPDLLHEGQRNADIGWQMSNLREHQRIHPDSGMPDYDTLPPQELRALASYLATRR